MWQLPHGEVGVITQVGRDGFTVLAQNGQSKTIADQEIQRKLFSSRVSALDKKGNHISVGEMVQVLEGAHAGQVGTIKHIYRSYIFLHNNRVVICMTFALKESLSLCIYIYMTSQHVFVKSCSFSVQS
jgi:transcription elongation factor